IPEGTETVNLTLTGPTGGASLGLSNAVLSIVDNATPNERFVAQVYLDLLQRPVDPGGLVYWTGLLNIGESRTTIASQVEASNEYRMNEVKAIYTHFLHRPADSTGLNAFVSFLGAGGTVEQVESAIVGSPEYLQNRGGGSNDGFLAALYQDALNRPIDPA